MKKTLTFLFFFVTLFVNSQNSVTRKIMEMGKTDNRTMQHLDVLTSRTLNLDYNRDLQ